MLSLLELYAPVPDETLSPLPPDSHRGITAVTTFALFSLVATAILFAHLLCRVLTWKRRTHGPVNPYVALLLNLVFADLQQALGFAFGIGWLKDDGIFAPDPMCWTQGWFLNAGDVASGLFTLAMAGHLFADIVFDYRMAHCPLVAMIVGESEGAIEQYPIHRVLIHRVGEGVVCLLLALFLYRNMDTRLRVGNNWSVSPLADLPCANKEQH